MSLHIAAQHLASQGRGPDDTLVHMSKGEVKNLQGIAKAHGGSLTINPKTGLPEAGFLQAILPTLEGAALVAGGAAMGVPIDPMMAAGIVGGVNGLASGSLMKGLSAGLGAYGGSNLANGMSFAGEQMAPGQVQDMAAQTSQAAPAVQPSTPLPSTAPVDTTPDLSRTGQLNPNAWDSVDSSAGKQATFGNAQFEPRPDVTPDTYGQGLGTNNASSLKANPYDGMSNMDILKQNATGKNLAYALGPAALSALTQQQTAVTPTSTHGTGRVLQYNPGINVSNGPIDPTGRGRSNFIGQGYTDAGTYSYASGGPVEQMSNANAIGANTGFPQADVHTGAYATPYQTPISQNIIQGDQDTRVDPYTGEEKLATGGIADAHYNLGGYSDGGRLLRGPGDGVSDSIPATIGHKQPARLADGEFVVPARIVSELGNGSTEAGARKLYAMMDRVQKARGKTVGKGKVATNSKADKYLPS